MKQILVVDDSSTVRKAVRLILEPRGYTVHEAKDGAQALRFCRERPGVDGILLDIEMPVMDGVSFLRALRADRRLRQPRVVMCTTRKTLDAIHEALGAGADEYIMKPFNAEVLTAKLSEVGLAC
jgi:two-component system chemotaxis response regulator CheY